MAYMESTDSDGSPRTDDEYLLLDDNGVALGANDEESLLMAMQYGEDLVVENSSEWYLGELARCQLHLAANPHLQAVPAAAAGKTTAVDVETQEVSSPDEQPEVDEEGWEEEEGMGAQSYSTRDYAEDDAEWVLESLLRRKPARRDGDGSRWVYLCKWKWFAEPTWESRTLLEEEGYSAQLDAFDTSKLPPAPVYKPTAVKKKLPMHSDLENFYPDIMATVRGKFKQDNLDIIRFASVQNAALTKRFLAQYANKAADHCPAVLFHGTRKVNMSSICRNGLVVPGTNGVRVLNGSAYGVGIYTAKNPGYSTSYTDTSFMFVCLGLVGPQFTKVKDVSNICVFFDASLVVPMWLVEFQRGPALAAPTRVSQLDFFTDPQLKISDEERHLMTNAGRSVPPRAASQSSAPSAPKTLTKKMLKQAPRSVKDLYKQGLLKQKREKS